MSSDGSPPLSPHNAPPARWVNRCAVALLLIHATLISWISYVNSPNLDEPAHLAAGMSHWTHGRFDLYRVNPPLVRMVAALPVLATAAEVDWSEWKADSPYSRSEFQVGKRFVVLNGLNSFWYFTLARWACLPLCLIGPWIAFMWAKKLYGSIAGLIAMLLYCFCPNCIAWGASITPDAVGTSTGVLAAFSFWCWLRKPSWKMAILAGVTLGLAELTKGTWIILWGLWPVIWFVHWVKSCSWSGATPQNSTVRSSHAVELKPSAPFRQLACLLVMGVYILHLGYGFEGSFKSLREYHFVSKLLSGQDSPPVGANRFEGTWLGLLPVPFPESYIRGIDVQKADFERGKWSYLLGEQKKGGWWYYYVVAFVVKSPIGCLLLIVIATALACRRRFRGNLFDECVLILPGVVLLLLVSSQTGFSRYLRYALPAFPFVYIHASRVGIALSARAPRLALPVVICCLGTIIESLSIFPHSMSFFNLIAGGPPYGHSYLLDANVDWGQDLLKLKKWYDEHPEARPFHLAYFGDMDVDPAAAGIVYSPVPGYLSEPAERPIKTDLLGPKAGWFAVSINHLYGYHHYESDTPQYTYFQNFEPVARAGYSIQIYHLTSDDAARLKGGDLPRSPTALPSIVP